jgi:2-polyprenyl-3-methyl-5-hydroxy-6-metoxy-1,4-benzoquinol methylase
LEHIYNDFDDQPDPPHQPMYLNKILRALSGEKSISEVLDLGCGDGNFSHSLALEGYQVIGLDASESGIRKAQEGPGEFYVGNIYDELSSQINRESVSAVVTVEVIEHLYDPKLFLFRCNEVLGDNGILIITTPYWGYLKNIVLSLSGRLDKALTVEWDGGHIKHFSRRSLTRMVENYGFTLEKFEGCGRRIPFLWRGMMLTFRKKYDVIEFHRY